MAVAIGVKQRPGRRITSIRFMAYGMPIMIVTVSIASPHVWIRYYVLGS